MSSADEGGVSRTATKTLSPIAIGHEDGLNKQTRRGINTVNPPSAAADPLR